ncbi:hypothetical protein OG474_04565 [Kribbella sp. NBC_01505]|uniref:hypothetical protein n=1 Tax=Kribbella sp. NBC_01505 TaxID=2903580 RepID=UPI00386619EF
MKIAYLTYFGWTVLGVLAVIALGVGERPGAKGGSSNPIMFAAVVFAPSLILGWLAGLGLVALFQYGGGPHPVLTGSLASGGALVAAAALVAVQVRFS